ncbi:MAG TPA: Fur family transcriptional regulator [Kofleriaceae bacterium]|jgi:Fur family ferric uptake transcriptional regulator
MIPKRKREQLRASLRAAGLRATSARLAVLELLWRNGRPLTHAQVTSALVAAGGGLDGATVYRNLSDMVEHGVARRTDLGDRVWRFEPRREEHDALAHPHFLCTTCGATACLPAIAFVEPHRKLPRSVLHRNVEVQIRGRCDACEP